jgi:hypothetical protein
VATATQLEHLPTDHDPPCRGDSTELVELADADEFELKIAPVPKRIGDATVGMLPTAARSLIRR